MSILTKTRLSTLKAWPSLESNWHFLSAATLAVVNKPKEIPVLYEYALTTVPSSEHGRLTSQFREGIFKSAALVGLPRVINGLTELTKATPSDLRAVQLLREDKRDFSKEGTELFAQVYGKIAERVHRNLHTAYPDLDWFIKNFEYGPLLSNMSVLSPKETSFVIIAALVPQNVDPQLKGHLKGAINNGATVDEVNSLREMAMTVSSWYGITFPDPVSKLDAEKEHQRLQKL